MATEHLPQQPTAPELLGELVRHSEHLLDLQLQVARAELSEELGKVGGAAVRLGAAAGLFAVGGVFASQLLVHLLRRATGLPLWACYAIAAGAAAGAGARLLASGRSRLGEVQLPDLPQTTAALKENLTWLKNQVTSPPT